MYKKIINVLIGDLDEKRQYKQIQKRVNMLPNEYRDAFKKIRKYIDTVGAPGETFDLDRNKATLIGIIELFESAAAEGRTVMDVVGNDPSMFCDELMLAYGTDTETRGDKLNREILEWFNGKQG